MALEKRDDCVLSPYAFQIPLEKCLQENGVNKVGMVVWSTRGVWYPPLWISWESSQPQAIPRVVSVPKVSGKGAFSHPVPPTLDVPQIS